MSRKTLIVLAGGAVACGVAIAVAVPAIKKKALRATAILKKDHRIMSGLFFALSQTTCASMHKSIFSQIRRRVEIHAQVEEEILYPAIRNLYTNTAQEQAERANRQHQQIKDLLHEISTIDPESYMFMSKCNELKEVVERHVEEEEGEVFPLAQSHMSGEELNHLGRRIHDRKAQLKEKAAA